MALASTSSISLQTLSLRQNAPSSKALASKSTPSIPVAAVLTNRRQLLFLSTATTALTARELAAKAQDIPLFGLRKKLVTVEKEAEEILKEGIDVAEKGIESAEKGIESAEKGIESAEKGIESAEKEIESAVSFGGLAQAGVVVAAEAVGVSIATSIVNGILGPESQRA